MADMVPSDHTTTLRAGRYCIAMLVLIVAAGCASNERTITPLERVIQQAAQPILTMDPDAVWTDCYNRLVELGPDSIVYLAEHPTLCRPAGPDDLRVMLHTSLLRLLIHPALRPPVSATCFETTLDLLHFDLKVSGRRLGTVYLPAGALPAAWHDLYPETFSHELAASINAEADRRVLRQWWLKRRGREQILATPPPLKPRANGMWRLLARRYADRWSYEPEARVIRCSARPNDSVMIHKVTYDYNLVRAACIWLGAAGQSEIRGRLIDLVASPSPIVAHNVMLALRYDPDRCIRDLLERYKQKGRTDPANEPADRQSHPTVTCYGTGGQQA